MFQPARVLRNIIAAPIHVLGMSREADVDAVRRHAVAAGARLLKPAEDTSRGGRSGCFADPDGHPWPIAWNPHLPLGLDGAIRLPD